MADIRIKDLPINASPSPSQYVATDLATTQKLTVQALVDIGVPVASQAEAEAGVQATKRMTPLTTAQAITARAATPAQGALADSAIQPGDLSAVATTGNYNDLSNQPSLSADLIYPVKANAIAATIPSIEHALRINGSVTLGDGLGGLYIDTNNGSADTFVSSGGTSRTWYRAADVSATRLVDAPDIRNFLDTASYVATRTAAKALDTTKETTLILTEAGREGIFNWKAGDYSAQIAADTAEGVYIKATAIAASAGAWVRVFYGGVDPMWFGAGGDGVAIDTAPVKNAAIIAMALNLPLWLGSKTWRVKDGQWPGYSGDELRTVVLIDGVRLVVRGEGATILFDGANVTEYATIFRCVNGGSLDREGVTLDYKNLPFSQGVCLSKTANSARFLLDTAACGVPTWADIERLSHWSLEPASGKYGYTETIFEVNGTHRAVTLVSGSTYDVSFTADVAALANVTVGQTYVLYHKVNGYYFSDVTDGSLTSRNCWTRAVSGMSDAGSYVEDFIIHGGGVAPPYGSRRIIATTSDGVAHVNGCSGIFDVQPDRVEGTSDDAANLNCPFNNVSAAPGGAVFTMSLVAPGRLPVVGDRLWGVAVDGSQQDMGLVLSIAGSVITMATALPVGFSAAWKVGNDTWITKGAIYWPRIVSRVAGGGAVIRGFSPIIRGSYSDVAGPAYSMVAFWAIYNEGPVSKHVDVDINAIRCGTHRDAVTGVIRFDAIRLDTFLASPAGVIVGGRIRAKISDCRPAALYMTSCDAEVVEIDSSHTGYDQWSALPQPTAVIYFQNCNNIPFIHRNSDSAIVMDYMQDCLRMNPFGSKNVNFLGGSSAAIHSDITLSSGGNAIGDGANLLFKSDAAPFEGLPMAKIKGFLLSSASAGVEQQGGLSFFARPVGSAGQVLTEKMRVTNDGVLIFGGGNSGGAGGTLLFRTGSGNIDVLPMSQIKGSLENSVGTTEQQGGISFQTRPVGAGGQVFTERLRLLSDGSFQFIGRTVASLGAAVNYAGSLAYITDASATTRQSVVAGGGANKVFVYSNATSWLIL